MLGMGDATQAPQQAPQAKPSVAQQEDQKRFVATGMTMLYDKKFLPQAEKLLADGQNTIEDMANIGSNLAMAAFKKASEAGQELDAMAILQGGEQLMREVAEFARATGAEVADEDIETAYISAADKFRQKAISQGMVSEEELNAQFEQLGEVAQRPEVQQAAARAHQNRQGGAPAAKEEPMKGMG